MRILLPIAAASLLTLGTVAGCGDDDGGGGTGGTGNAGPAGTVTVEADITADTTWTADSEYLVRGVVRVAAGATLTIEPGTIVKGDKGTTGTIVIQKGGKIDARGTADAPIVFTSALPEGERRAGDWGGLILLGNAPINAPGGEASIEGLTGDESYGGSDPADNSGVLEYVRIEFSGIEISPDNEINGLTFGGVGSGTTVNHVMVRHTLDDCFEFFGGTVNASHLVCYRNGDDGFDFDEGYVGKLQFLFLQADPNIADSANGFEADNDSDVPDQAPVTNPTIYNVTLIGQGEDQASQQYGFLFRRGFNATIGNAIVMGYEAGVDFRDTPFTNVAVSSSIFFDNAPENIAYPEDGSNEDEQEDDDEGFDEVMWFTTEESNSVNDPGLADPYNATPDPRPASMIAGEAPSGSFFDSSATYIGAFRDGSDDWMTGAWVDFGAN